MTVDRPIHQSAKKATQVLILTMKLWKLALFAQIGLKKATTPAIRETLPGQKD
jgi:hypothetical protein